MTASYPGATPDVAALRGNLIDNLASTLAGDVAIDAVSITLDDASDFPTSGLLSIRAANGNGPVELLAYTTKTGDVISGITRNFNGRHASAWVASDLVELLWAADHHNRHVAETIALATDLRNAIRQDLDDSVAAATTAASLKARIDQMATQLKLIISGTDWKDAPAATIAALKSSVDTLLTNVGTLTTTVADHGTRLTTAESDIDTAQANIVDLQKYQIADLYPSQNLVADNKVLVHAGHFVKSDGSARVAYAGGQSPAFDVIVTNPRIDLLCIDDTGTLSIVKGTEALAPTVPTYPTNKQVIAHVSITEGADVIILQADITDARAFLNLGGGVGSGTNYGTGADAALTNWSTYADAAGVSPVDGTGGSPTVTIALSSVSPLRGASSWVITKDAANRQGEGAALAFTIDAADQAKVLSIQFDYNASAALAAGSASDIRVWVYDITNSALIPVTPSTIEGNGANNYTFKGVFQAAYNSLSYRLIFHVATVNAAAWTLKGDNLYIGPQTVLQGTPVTDWKSFTMTVTGSTSNPTKGTVTTDNAQWRRVGDSMEIHWEYQQSGAGADGNGVYLFALPSGFSIDTTKLVASSTSGGDDGRGICGVASSNTTVGGENRSGYVKAYDATHLIMMVGDATSNPSRVSNTFGNLGAANRGLAFRAIVPIVGWSSQCLMSNDADTRTVAFAYYGATEDTIGTGDNIIKFTTKVLDTHGTYNPATGLYTVPVSGVYTIRTYCYPKTAVASSVANNGLYVQLRKNGSAIRTSIYVYPVTGVNLQPIVGLECHLPLVAGDTLDVNFFRDSSVASFVVKDYLATRFEVAKVSGPSAIAASELVCARYDLGSAKTSDASNPLDFPTKVIDTHGAVTTGAAWKFTCPIAGKYRVSIVVGQTSTNIGIYAYKNGVLNAYLTDNASDKFSSGSTIVDLIPGDYIDVRFSASRTTYASAAQNICIERLGK
jgi:hypothetical protein